MNDQKFTQWTVNELVAQFNKSQTGVISDSTLKWYESYLAPWQEALGEKLVEEISIDELRDCFQKLRKEVSSIYTLFNYVRACKRLFKWAVEEDLIIDNPAKKLKKPSLPKKSPAGIDENDFIALLEAAQRSPTPERNLAILHFLFDTGVRVGGAASLTIENLNLPARRAIVLEKGRGGKKERVVFFQPQTAEILQIWLETRTNNPEKRVFGLNESGIYQMLERLAKQANIKGRWNPHAFRHGFARRLLSKGLSIGILSHLMGHSNVQVTIEFYGRFANDELQQIYDQVTTSKSN